MATMPYSHSRPNALSPQKEAHTVWPSLPMPCPPAPRPAVRSAPRGLPPLGTSPKWARTPFVLWCLASLTEQVSRVQPCCRALSGLQSLS